MTEVKICICDHEGQDKMYGDQRRLMNSTGVKGSRKWRCTVCEKEQSN